MDLSYRIAAVVIIIILFLVIKGIYDEKRYKQRLYLRLKNSWGNPSRQEYPQQLMDAVKYYYNNNKAWIPQKDLEKLGTVIKQNQAKKECLQKI